MPGRRWDKTRQVQLLCVLARGSSETQTVGTKENGLREVGLGEWGVEAVVVVVGGVGWGVGGGGLR